MPYISRKLRLFSKLSPNDLNIHNETSFSSQRNVFQRRDDGIPTLFVMKFNEYKSLFMGEIQVANHHRQRSRSYFFHKLSDLYSMIFFFQRTTYYTTQWLSTFISPINNAWISSCPLNLFCKCSRYI